MVTLSENAEDNLPRVVKLSWRVRLALLTIFLLAVGTVYITNQFLTARFTQTTLQRAQLRLALYSGNLVSELQKNSIVPSLLGSDAELIGEQLPSVGVVVVRGHDLHTYGPSDMLYLAMPRPQRPTRTCM